MPLVADVELPEEAVATRLAKVVALEADMATEWRRHSWEESGEAKKCPSPLKQQMACHTAAHQQDEEQ